MGSRRLLVALFALAACGTQADEPSGVAVAPVPTIDGVGFLPDEVPISTLDPGADGAITPDVVVTRPVDADGVVADPVADLVAGNRLLVIGDSILASTASRYGGELCEGLEPLGWAVEVNAEPGRFIEFGNRVLDRRLPDVDGEADDDWDAAVVHLGSNYGLDAEAYRAELDELLARLAPRPTLLLTVTVYRPAWEDVNDIIVELAADYPNAVVVDWERTARAPGVLSRDGLHPGDAGEQVLVELIAAALGDLPGAEPDCLPTRFTDDSQIGGGSGGTSSSSTGSAGRGSSSGSSSGGSAGSSSGSSGGSSGSTADGGSSAGGSGSTGTSGVDGGGDATGGSDSGDTSGGSDSGDTSGATGGSDSGDSSGGSDSGDTSGGGDGGDSSGGSDSGDSTGGDSSGGSDGSSDTGGSSDGGSNDTSGGTGGSDAASTSGGGSDSSSGGDATGGGSDSSGGGDATGGGSDTSGGGSDSSGGSTGLASSSAASGGGDTP
ncbi:MAG: hypothetical protein AAFP84_09980 [Actinomycetota bacterium]